MLKKVTCRRHVRLAFVHVTAWCCNAWSLWTTRP